MPGRVREPRRINGAESTIAPDPYEASVAAVTNGLVASAQVLTYENTKDLVIPPREWQNEAWGFYNTIGEVGFAIGTWLANCMSRVRLVVATRPPDSDSPVPVTKGPHAKLVADLASGTSGQAAMMRRLTVQLSVPGDSYLVLENTAARGMTVRVFSSSELRIISRNSASTRYDRNTEDASVSYEVMVDRASWRPLAADSLVCRIWVPDDQFAWSATSVMRTALPICREIDFYNRYIIAILLSRLAMNGVLLWPQEATFPAKEAFKDSADPMMAEFIEIASKAISNPGTAAAAIPIPIKMPAEFIDKVKHLEFSTEMSQHVLANRQEALKRLAVSMNVPTEVLTGMGDLNHWGQWQLEESGIKTYIAPGAEVIVAALTEGWFVPMEETLGLPLEDENGDRYFVWYDTTELQQTPDKSNGAIQLYDDGELKAESLRRSVGFSEDDKPSNDEFKEIALRKISMAGGADAMKALSILTGDKSLMPEPPPALATDGTTDQPPNGPPGESGPPAQTQSPTSVPKTAPPTRPASLEESRTATFDVVH